MPADLSVRATETPVVRSAGPLRKQLWFWVLIGLSAGVVFGLVAPDQAVKAKWLADAFLQLVKTIAAPVIFVTVVIGIASLGNLARAGALAVRALGYFFAATTVALVLGLIAGNVVKPGEGLAIAPNEAGRAAADESIKAAGDANETGLASSSMTWCQRASSSPSSRTRSCGCSSSPSSPPSRSRGSRRPCAWAS